MMVKIYPKGSPEAQGIKIRAYKRYRKRGGKYGFGVWALMMKKYGTTRYGLKGKNR